MALQYLNRMKSRKQKNQETHEKPVLNEEDEQFLHKITNESSLPPAEQSTVILDNGKQISGKDAQTALMDGADRIPLPQSPPLENTTTEKKRRSYWSRLPSISFKSKGKEKERAAADLKSAADALNNAETDVKPDINVIAVESKEEEEADLTAILDQLNLAAVNNRVFSFSKESQELLEKFKLVLKDIVNGVPTAYDDLEKLLTNSENQLKNMFGSLPPFLQTLVKSLPSKMSAVLAPELLAAASEKPGADGVKLAGTHKKSKKSRIPTLKSLVSQQGAVAALLRSILNFLKLRFPAVMAGTNVLMSLAVFLLLFVFWYCHKRGRETRLERERLAAEGGEGAESDLERSSSELDDSTVLSNTAGSSGTSRTAEPPTTIQTDPSIDNKPNATVADMPSVLDLPDPAKVPLPSPDPQNDIDAGLKK